MPLVPELRNVQFESERVGLLAFSMDGEPILGPVAALPGFYVALAFHSGGFAYNPAAGLLMAEYASEGITSINIEAFSPDRFPPDQAAQFLSDTMRQKDIFHRRH